ncbi:MAG: hypothetical protein IT437_01155 [Phycisphaerales bacterium]|nr:hypothetical protein [Phycisphaerales bacterium]
MRRVTRRLETVQTEYPCRRCGYDLHGLVIGAACPECGTPMAPPQVREGGDTLVDAPDGYLQKLCIGLVLMSVGAIAVLLSVAGRGSLHLYAVAGGVPAWLAWGAGAWIVTRPRPRTGHRNRVLDAEWLRWSVRAGAAAWVVASAAAAAAIFLPIVAPPRAIPGVPAPLGAPLFSAINVARLAAVMQGLAMLGLAPIGVFLGSLAAWAGDSGLADRFRIAAWTVGVGSATGLLLLVAAPRVPGLAGALTTGSIVSWGVAMLGVVLLFASVVQMAVLSWWAVSNSARQAAARARLARERAIHEEQMASRTTGGSAPGTSASPIGPGSRVTGHPAGEHIVPRPVRRKKM